MCAVLYEGGYTVVVYLPLLSLLQAERNLRQRRHHQGAFEFFGSVDGIIRYINTHTTT